MKRKNRFFVIIILVVLGVVLSVSFFKKEMKMEDKIINFYKTNCKNKEDLCFIDFKEIISHWDAIYIFNKGVDDREIKEITGYRYNKEEDISYKFIVIKDNKIKSSYEIFISPYEIDNSYLAFSYGYLMIDNHTLEYTPTSDFYKLSRDNSIIALNKVDVMINDNEGYTVYVAYPVNKKQVGLENGRDITVIEN